MGCCRENSRRKQDHNWDRYIHVHQSGEDEVGPPSKIFLERECFTIAKEKKTIEAFVHRISELRKEGQKTKKKFMDQITLDQSISQSLQPR
jgi:hypothetical protein